MPSAASQQTVSNRVSNWVDGILLHAIVPLGQCGAANGAPAGECELSCRSAGFRMLPPVPEDSTLEATTLPDRQRPPQRPPRISRYSRHKSRCVGSNRAGVGAGSNPRVGEGGFAAERGLRRALVSGAVVAGRCRRAAPGF
jgi:hypothetical protein